jgi:hypothetical protein
MSAAVTSFTALHFSKALLALIVIPSSFLGHPRPFLLREQAGMLAPAFSTGTRALFTSCQSILRFLGNSTCLLPKRHDGHAASELVSGPFLAHLR